MIRTIDGKRYLMRDTRPVKELRALHKAYEAKFGQGSYPSQGGAQWQTQQEC